MPATTTKPSFQTLKTPPVGQHWPNQGGVYAGIVRVGFEQWHLIMAVELSAVIRAPWGKQNHLIPGEFSRWDGLHNTQLILAAEPENTAALFTQNLSIDGHSDFYWPAECELSLLAINLPDHTGNGSHWSSTQKSSHVSWYTNFRDAYNSTDLKIGHCAVRAVRRIPITTLNQREK